MNTKIILVRHAQSLKNIKNVHGGPGERLTAKGRKETDLLVRQLIDIGVNSNNSVIIAASSIQTKETAKIISEKLNIDNFEMSDFRPLYLGLVHGMSNELVYKKYPDIFRLLMEWRNKKIEICDLKIPEMESPFEFYNRGLKILDKVHYGKYNIFVATNSLYILLLNILLGNTCFEGGGYKHFNIPNCGISVFNIGNNGKYELDIFTTNVDDVLSYG